MSKRKKHSGNFKKQTKAKKEILQLEDCSKNDECGVSSVDEIKVIVFYNGPNYKVKIVIPKRSITKKILKVQNSKFDLYIRFRDLDYSESGGHLYIELKGRYKLDDRLKKPNECSEVKLGINAKRYYGSIVLQPDFFIPENWSSSVDSKEDEIAFRHYKSDIRKMGINASNYTNYEKSNVYRPFQGGDCTGGNSMAFEDYKDLDLKPEKATQEEIEQLRKKYGVSDFNDSSMAREFLRRQEEQN